MKDHINIAIVGLGRVGTTFLKKLFDYRERGISIIAVTELNPDSPGLEFAAQKGIPVVANKDDITAMGEQADVIFNLTGDPSIERTMRLAQVKGGNHKTVVGSTVMASLLWKLISEEALPQHSNFALNR